MASTSGSSPLLAAVAAYKQAALTVLTATEVQEGIRLLKEVNRRLPSRNLLEADKAVLKVAGREVLAGERPEARAFLSREVARFFDAAFAAGLVARHPLTESVQLPPRREEEDGSRTAAAASEIVSGLIEEGIAAGMMLSPLAVPTAELGQSTVLDEALAGLDGRWGAVAEKAQGLLEVARVVLPVVSLILALSTVAGGRDPLGSRANAAFATGNAMQQIKIMVNLLDTVEVGTEGADSLAAVGARVGVPTAEAEKVFELERLRRRPTVLFLRHRDSGALVAVGPEVRATLVGGHIRMRR